MLLSLPVYTLCFVYVISVVKLDMFLPWVLAQCWSQAPEGLGVTAVLTFASLLPLISSGSCCLALGDATLALLEQDMNIFGQKSVARSRMESSHVSCEINTYTALCSVLL